MQVFTALTEDTLKLSEIHETSQNLDKLIPLTLNQEITFIRKQSFREILANICSKDLNKIIEYISL